MTDGELILYQTDDGRAEIQLRAMDGSVWLTQAEIAALFDTSPQAITQLIRAVYDDAELTPEATCKDFLQVRTEGKREVQRKLKSYNLDMILAVGYRVRSPRGIQIGPWSAGRVASYYQANQTFEQTQSLAATRVRCLGECYENRDG